MDLMDFYLLRVTQTAVDVEKDICLLSGLFPSFKFLRSPSERM